MTKKHFKMLVEHLARIKVHSDGCVSMDRVVEVLMDFCREVNPYFNRDKFVDYLDKVRSRR